MKLTQTIKSDSDKTEKMNYPTMVKIIPESQGYLESIDEAVLWCLDNPSEKKRGHFATDLQHQIETVTSQQLIKLHLADKIPTWVTCFYWSE